MLITTRLNKCKGCEDLTSIIDELDCYIAGKMGIVLQNKKFSLSRKIDFQNLRDAITIRNILLKRSHNPSYLCEFNILDIINVAKKSTYR